MDTAVLTCPQTDLSRGLIPRSMNLSGGSPSPIPPHNNNNNGPSPLSSATGSAMFHLNGSDSGLCSPTCSSGHVSGLIQQQQPLAPPPTRSCAGCGGRIEDRMLLNALDRFWHTGCLKCSCCHVALNDVGSSFFARGNMILCRKDYIKMFGTTGTCASCGLPIPADEMVMRCQGNVYHLRCFACAHCHTQLQPGERFSLINGSLFCEHEFPRLFGGGWSPLAGGGGVGGAVANGNGLVPPVVPGGSTPNSVAPGQTGSARGRQKKVDARRCPLQVC